MTDATILVPTFRHAKLLPFALSSALAQQGAEVEVFVVGDGVEDDTRAAVEPFVADARVRFFDFPKGERHGELHRHEALQHARGRIVCYLCDDDLLLPGHVAESARLLEDADLAHSAPFAVQRDGSLVFLPIDIARPEFQTLLWEGGWNAVSLTGASHTLEAYRRLPCGWRPAPPDVWTDLYMWQQFLLLPDFRGRTGTTITHLHFPELDRRDVPVEERVAELESWWARVERSDYADELTRLAMKALRQVALDREAQFHALESALRNIQPTP